MIHNNNTVPLGELESQHKEPVFRVQGRRQGSLVPSGLSGQVEERGHTGTTTTLPGFVTFSTKHRRL
ncbi:unnamed protein product [Tetraodon nigroviridis]|uniref:(spotted green pufferfish) hypothetical protein n=1 Tax=Tetraodon nigroviridis TaxID=99883 RepID=Q4RTV9_TETNG|nr:unnamed protein product [Tetraodon nigroviridis]